MNMRTYARPCTGLGLGVGVGVGVGVERLVQVQQLLVLRAGHMPRGAEGLDVHERLWWHGTSMGQ